MTDPKKGLTFKEELEALQLEEAMQRLELTKQQVQAFREEQQNRARVSKIRVEASAAEEAERKRRQGICKHKTGGKGKPGFLYGDGAKGYSISHQVLPTGEYYMMCIRCQKEWHHPMWQVKFEILDHGQTEMKRSEYDQQVREYQEALELDHPYTELAEASRFRIPRLDNIEMSKVKFKPEDAA